MQAVHGHAGPTELSCKLPRKKDVAEFRAAIRAPAGVQMLTLKVTKVDFRQAMQFRSDIDNSSRSRLLDPIEQELGQQEIGHVIEGEGTLESIFGHFAATKDSSRVVDQDINLRQCRQRLTQSPNLIKPRQIGIVDFDSKLRAA